MDCQPFASQSTWTSRGNISQITSLIKRPAVWNGLKPKNLETSKPAGNSLNQVECLATLTRRPGRRDTPAPLHLLALSVHPSPVPPTVEPSAPPKPPKPPPTTSRSCATQLLEPWFIAADTPAPWTCKRRVIGAPLIFPWWIPFEWVGVVGRGDDGGCSFAFRGEWAGLLVVDRRPKDDSNFKCNPLFSRECVSMLRL